MNQRTNLFKTTTLLLTLAAILLVPGCDAFNRFPGEAETIEVQARYLDLNDRSVAVVVALFIAFFVWARISGG